MGYFTALIRPVATTTPAFTGAQRAKYRITIGIESEGQVLDEAQIDETIQLLKSQLVNYGIIYKSVEVAPDQRQIAFNIIGRLTSGEEGSRTRLLPQCPGRQIST
ncbi:MAG: hypothetical protein IPN33_06365 [Saprospiraceae bacterium]|nr:hypothetical protein [Saprospiraceae bacterium]